MLASHLRGRINRIVEPLGRAVGRTGISANDLTVSGAVIMAVGTLLVANGRLLLGGMVVTVGGLLDLVDGAVAKATGTETPFGAFLDSTTDRLSDGLLFSGLACRHTWTIRWPTVTPESTNRRASAGTMTLKTMPAAAMKTRSPRSATPTLHE